MKQLMLFTLILILFTACTKEPVPYLKGISDGGYYPQEYSALDGWEDENFEDALKLFKKSCKKTRGQALFAKVCRLADNAENAQDFFERNFTPFISLSDSSLATGYFEPMLEGSYEKSLQYPYPIYGVPSDLLRIEITKEYQHYNKNPLRGRIEEGKVVPYYSREEINEGALDIEPICYVSDRIERFFLHVQGSGQIHMEDGERLYVGYADQNGFPYVSIGSQMIKKGMLEREEVSLESIQRYLERNPEVCDDILELNPSYIFFEERMVGATGALGIPLVGGRSIAVDKKQIPLGMPVFIQTRGPINAEPYERLMFAHDTGGAIRGESRIDIFFGSGRGAREQAGHMKDHVKLWILIPNDYLSGIGVK